jgi:hypothetical protein
MQSPRKTGSVENRGGDRFGHEHDPLPKPVTGLTKHPGTNATPVGGMGEHELVNAPTPNPLSLTNSPRENSTDNVPNLVHTGPEQQLRLINPPLGMRLVP